MKIALLSESDKFRKMALRVVLDSDPSAVPCSFCTAGEGEPCQKIGRRITQTQFHQSRINVHHNLRGWCEQERKRIEALESCSELREDVDG